MKELIRNILKEELEGQEFIDNFNQEKQRFERTKDEIIGYISSQYPTLVDVEYRTKTNLLGSTRVNNENPRLEIIVVTLKFKNLSDEELKKNSSNVLKKDIINIFDNYFGFNVLGYASPIQLEFKAQAWVIF
jgi:hypothetical protein